MTAAAAPVHTLVRRLEETDLDRIMEIELTAYPYPWTRGIFADCIRVGYDCWGLQVGDVLAGYSVQTHAAGESHLLNLCIAPEFQRRGLGSILLDNAIRTAHRQNCTCLFLEVRPSNRAGIGIYRKYGFVKIGERPEYYRSDNGKESAIVMLMELENEAF